MPEEEAVPIPWHLIAQWRRLPEDEEKQFEQRIQLILPNGKITHESSNTFNLQSNSYRHVLRFTGMPVGLPGNLLLRLSVREANTTQRWKNVTEYPLEVHYERFAQ